MSTREKILVAALLLYNDRGEPGTTTNDIADAVDISPGNLHYHFRRKADIVAALLEEFRADAAKVLRQPPGGSVSLDDFWIFLHLLVECTAAYRFLFRDMETLSKEYPAVRRALASFAKALVSVFELYLRTLCDSRILTHGGRELHHVARDFAVVALFSERLAELVETPVSADAAALRTASSILNLLRPLATRDAARHLERLAAAYGPDGPATGPG